MLRPRAHWVRGLLEGTRGARAGWLASWYGAYEAMIGGIGKKAKSGLRAESTTGRVSVVLLGLFAVVALALGAYFFVESDGDRGAGRGLPGTGPTDSGAAEAERDMGTPAVRANGSRAGVGTADRTSEHAPAAGEDLAFGPGSDPDRRRFEGTGVLRGHVQVLETDRPTDGWHLELVPSRIYAGSEHAEGRTQRYTSDAFDFRIEDLPFGAYDVRAVAAGYNGAWLSFVLDASHDDSFVNLSLLPAGFLEGQVVDGEGNALEGIGLWLVAEADGSRLRATSDAFGRYRFERVPDGAYDLVLGSLEDPYREPERLAFRAPSMTLPPLELAGLGILIVQVLDPDEVPVIDAHVTGNAPGVGKLDGRTDVQGTLVVEHLAQGRAHLRVTHPGFADTRRSADVGPGIERTLQIFLRPPR